MTEKRELIEKREVILAAKILSGIFRPNRYPLVGIIILLVTTYLALLPWGFKLGVIAIVYLLTIGIPNICTNIYRHHKGWSMQELRHQHKRIGPLCISIACQTLCMLVLDWLRMPNFVIALMLISILVQIMCVVTSLWWKISVHSAGGGALIGALVVYSLIFQFNPIWWLCLAILVSGLVNSSRMLLRQHTLWQVLGGTWIGVICGLLGIILA